MSATQGGNGSEEPESRRDMGEAIQLEHLARLEKTAKLFEAIYPPDPLGSLSSETERSQVLTDYATEQEALLSALVGESKHLSRRRRDRRQEYPIRRRLEGKIGGKTHSDEQ